LKTIGCKINSEILLWFISDGFFHSVQNIWAKSIKENKFKNIYFALNTSILVCWWLLYFTTKFNILSEYLKSISNLKNFVGPQISLKVHTCKTFWYYQKINYLCSKFKLFFVKEYYLTQDCFEKEIRNDRK